ncbi:MAG: ACP phosphodiesterase [Planctomycetota bacterium]|jgi:acyl carrier protein phosphodiesterase
MNFLAHAVLSPNDDAIMFGNVLGDFIKGRPDGSLSPAIWKGVRLHRWIDRTADEHPRVHSSLQLLPRRYRHYARVVLDIYHDYLLAQHFEALSGGIPLCDFIEDLDQRFQRIRKQFPGPKGPHHLDWLDEYESLHGVTSALGRASRRSRRGVDLSDAAHLLPDLQRDLEEDFLDFFPALQVAAAEYGLGDAHAIEG